MLPVVLLFNSITMERNFQRTFYTFLKNQSLLSMISSSLCLLLVFSMKTNYSLLPTLLMVISVSGHIFMQAVLLKKKLSSKKKYGSFKENLNLVENHFSRMQKSVGCWCVVCLVIPSFHLPLLVCHVWHCCSQLRSGKSKCFNSLKHASQNFLKNLSIFWLFKKTEDTQSCSTFHFLLSFPQQN